MISEAVFSSKKLVELFGAPGVGKTTLMNKVIDDYTTYRMSTTGFGRSPVMIPLKDSKTRLLRIAVVKHPFNSLRLVFGYLRDQSKSSKCSFNIWLRDHSFDLNIDGLDPFLNYAFPEGIPSRMHELIAQYLMVRYMFPEEWIIADQYLVQKSLGVALKQEDFEPFLRRFCMTYPTAQLLVHVTSSPAFIEKNLLRRGNSRMEYHLKNLSRSVQIAGFMAERFRSRGIRCVTIDIEQGIAASSHELVRAICSTD